MPPRSPFSRKVTFIHTGHIGDIIAFLPAFQLLGGEKIVVRDEPWMNPPMKGFRYDSLKPLLESQGIEVFYNSDCPSVDYDMSNWRECYRHDVSLLDCQARFLNVVPRHNGHLEISKPWLKVDADPLTKGRVIFNRSARYRNYNFPWDKVLKHFGKRALFTGTKQEHTEFLNEVGEIEYYETPSCLDVAKAIEGADFFVGNQSSSCWIAMGLRKPLLQETFDPAPNSMVQYPGAWYGFAKNIPFDKLEK
jgi:hypothetical protein